MALHRTAESAPTTAPACAGGPLEEGQYLTDGRRLLCVASDLYWHSGGSLVELEECVSGDVFLWLTSDLARHDLRIVALGRQRRRRHEHDRALGVLHHRVPDAARNE